MQQVHTPKITAYVALAMLIGLVTGLLIHWQLDNYPWLEPYVINAVFNTGGQIFLRLLQMLVVPLVFVSLLCGVNHLGNGKRLGFLSIKTIALYVLTSALALMLALFFAELFHVGEGINIENLATVQPDITVRQGDLISYFIPANLFHAMVEGQMLPLIIATLIIGYAIMLSGEAGKRIIHAMEDVYTVILRVLVFLIYLTPIGVFCLIAQLFAISGMEVIGPLLKYSSVMLLVILIHLCLLSVILLQIFARLNPLTFFRKMSAPMMLAFSTASSNATLPLTLNTVHTKLGVRDRIASFSIPLGTTINMDGGAILQGMAIVFIANAFQIDLTILDYCIIVTVATFATVGTAGVPGVGIITLALVLSEVGLPLEGIALVIGVDRLLEMFRTMTNITGDAMVSCAVAHSEKGLDRAIYNKRD